MEAQTIIQGEKPISIDAIKYASELITPDMNLSFDFKRKSTNWKHAFDWYNKFINARQFPLGMSCAPCFGKVLNALRRAKKSNPVAVLRPEKEPFEEELRALINRYSKENASNTPDFILAEYLNGCLENFNNTLKKRIKWYGPVKA